MNLFETTSPVGPVPAFFQATPPADAIFESESEREEREAVVDQSAAYGEDARQGYLDAVAYGEYLSDIQFEWREAFASDLMYNFM